MKRAVGYKSRSSTTPIGQDFSGARKPVQAAWSGGEGGHQFGTYAIRGSEASRDGGQSGVIQAKWPRWLVRLFSRRRPAAPAHAPVVHPPVVQPPPDALLEDQDPKNTSGDREPADAALRSHVRAYRRARFYHGVKYPDDNNAWQNIQQQGLRTDKAGTGAATMSGFSINPEQVKGKVHVSTNRQISSSYAAGPEYLTRPVLGPERTEYRRGKRVPFGQTAVVTREGFLRTDPDHPGKEEGAFTTQENIPADQILFGTNRQMIQRVRGGHGTQADRNILETVKQQYEGQPPASDQELLALHEQAIDDGYISD